MKRCLILALSLLLLLTCAACGGAAAPDTAEAPAEDRTYSDSGLVAPYENEWIDEAEGAVPSYSTDMDVGEAGSVYDRANAKLIRQAQLNMETLDFGEATAILDAMVLGYNGYYESSDVWGGAYEGATRSGHYIVRVPNQAYESFMGAVGDVGHLVRRVETTENVGEAYYDAELRLGTLRTKHDRLLALLDKAADMESIITLQGYLAEVEYEVDHYAGTLRRYDALIDYATIEISLEERVQLSNEAGEKSAFAAQFGAAFGKGLGSFAAAVKGLLLWAAYHFIGLLFLAAVVIVIVLLRRKFPDRRWFSRSGPMGKVPASPLQRKQKGHKGAQKQSPQEQQEPQEQQD